MSVWPSARATDRHPSGRRPHGSTRRGSRCLTHFLSPTPYSLLHNPTWQHSRDSSSVWGQVISSSSDPNFVAPGAIPWLLLEAAVVGNGPTGGDKLLVTRCIQRVNTVDGGRPRRLRQPSGHHEEGTRALRSRPLLLQGESVQRSAGLTFRGYTGNGCK